MNIADFTETVVALVWVLCNLILCGLAGSYYLSLRKPSLVLIATACGLGAVGGLLPWIGNTESSWGLWFIVMFIHIADAVLWVIGSWLLFKEFAVLVRKQDAALQFGSSRAP